MSGYLLLDGNGSGFGVIISGMDLWIANVIV